MKTTSTIGGYTLTEMMISVSIFSVVMTVALSAFSMAGRRIRVGTQQVILNNTARQAQQRIARYIENGKMVDTQDGFLIILQTNDVEAVLKFVEGPNHPNSLRNSLLVYYPDRDDQQNQVIVADHVREIDQNDMFRVEGSDFFTTAFLSFHIGLGPEDLPGFVGPGLSGVDVRMSSIPRNRQQIWWANE